MTLIKLHQNLDCQSCCVNHLNSTLQAFFHIPSIANCLTSDTTHMERCEEELGIQGGCIICCMSKTLLSSQSQQSCIRQAMEKEYLMRFRHYKDLDQFSKETTPPNQILGGYLKSAVRCLACGYESTTFQHFEDLLLDIRKADAIDEALEGYFSRERLEDMEYKCESCKKKVSAFLYAWHKNQQASNHSTTSRFFASQNCGHYTAIGLTESGKSFALNNGIRNATASHKFHRQIEDTAKRERGLDEEKVTTTSNEVRSTTTLPNMPTLGMSSPVHPTKNKSAAVSSTATAAVSATIKSPLKSLVPYESETPTTNDSFPNLL